MPYLGAVKAGRVRRQTRRGGIPARHRPGLRRSDRDDLRGAHLVDHVGPELHQLDPLGDERNAVIDRAGRGVEAILLDLDQGPLESAPPLGGPLGG